jgi:hypothetical protein
MYVVFGSFFLKLFFRSWSINYRGPSPLSPSHYFKFWKLVYQFVVHRARR